MARLILVLVILFSCLRPVAAQSLVVLGGGGGHYLDQGNLAVLRDPGGQLDVREVADPARAGAFTVLPGNLGAGYVSGAVWVRVNVSRTAGVPGTWWLELLPPYLDDARLYQPDGRGGYREFHSGDLRPFRERSHAYRGFVFPLELPAGTSTLYLRLTSTSTMAAVLSLWMPAEHEDAVQREYLLFGIEKGLLLAIWVFSLYAWLGTREPLQASFCLLAFCQWVVGVTVHGFAAQYVLPDHPSLSGALYGIWIGLNAAACYYFFLRLLDLKRSYLWLHRFYQVGIAVGVASAVATPLGLNGYVAPGLFAVSVLSCLTIYWPCRDRLRRGRGRDWVEAFGMLVFAVITLVNLLGVLGIGPVKLMVLNGTYLAASAYLLLLGFGVQLRIREANQRHAQAAQAMERERLIREDQGRFMAMLAHEIRTPMAVVGAAVQSLQALDPAADPPRRKRYQRIEGAIRRMDALLHACLAEERLNGGHGLIRHETVDLAGLSRLVIDELPDPQRRRFQVSGEPVPTLQGDPEMLRVVLSNLIDNAVKYAPPDTAVSVTMATVSHQGQAGVAWRIENAGPVLAPALCEAVFEKYVRGQEGKGSPGLGLGLYLSRRIVTQHGGWLVAEAGRSEGVAFQCWLPCVAPPCLESD